MVTTNKVLGVTMHQIPLLDPRRDVVFKTIFSKDTIEASIARNSLISAFLGRKIQESAVINNEIPIDDIRDKSSRLDLQCVLEDNTKVNIEIQMYNASDSIENRLTYYTSQLYAGQAIKGKPFTELKEVYVILISNETLFPKRKHHFSKVCYRFEDGEEFCTKQYIMILELQKMTDTSNIEMESVEKWGTFFTNASNERKKELLEQLKKTDEGIYMASTLLERISQDEKERAVIFEREKILTDYYAGLASAEQQGIKQGKEEGMEEGIKQRNLEIAAIMKSQGFAIEQISNITGLTEQEIQKA